MFINMKNDTFPLISTIILLQMLILCYPVRLQTSVAINWNLYVALECDRKLSGRISAIQNCMLVQTHVKHSYFKVDVWDMMTSSNGNFFRVTGPLCGEFTGHRWIPRTKASDAELWCFFFYLRLNQRPSKQSWGWWSETLSCSLWRHRND